eukprot:2717786-Lingulodinium_polyedra.AAC.1
MTADGVGSIGWASLFFSSVVPRFITARSCYLDRMCLQAPSALAVMQMVQARLFALMFCKTQ